MLWTVMNLIILAANVIIAAFGYFKLYRHRVIYRVDKVTIDLGSFEPPMPSNEGDKMLEINGKLALGEYTILSVSTDHEHQRTDFYLGRIRK